MFGYAISWDKPWSRLEIGHLVGLGLFGSYVIACVVKSDPWVPIIDSANLAFHEFGHPFFAAFGDTMGWLGGTLGQLVFPTVGMGVFLYRHHTASFAMCAIWFFQNFFNIARYLGDARTQELPLVGGGEHDWGYLLGKWGVLAKDTQIAGYLRGFAWLGLLAIAGWLGWRLYRQRLDARAEAEQAAARRAATPPMPYAKRYPPSDIAKDQHPELPPLPLPKSAARGDAPLTIPPVRSDSKL